MSGKVHRDWVFLNFPFDEDYRELYFALVSGLVLFGLKPRCVIEEPQGRERLERLIPLLASCGSSIHDLSRIEGRHNMPFELGLARMLQHRRPSHQIFVLGDAHHELDRTCSDMKAFDPLVHEDDPSKLLAGLESKFKRTGNPLRWTDIEEFWEAVRDILTTELRPRRGQDIFSAAIFHLIIDVSGRAARDLELLR